MPEFHDLSIEEQWRVYDENKAKLDLVPCTLADIKVGQRFYIDWHDRREGPLTDTPDLVEVASIVEHVVDNCYHRCDVKLNVGFYGSPDNNETIAYDGAPWTELVGIAHQSGLVSVLIWQYDFTPLMKTRQ